MADNPIRYGLRWSPLNGTDCPNPIEIPVPTSQSFDVNGGASNVNLGPGDIVRLDNTGGADLCDGVEGAGGALAPYGVVVGVKPYWNASTGRMEFSDTLPSDVAWGTNLARQSKILVVPIELGYWDCDCDDAVTATTEAAYQTLVGLNIDVRHAGASGELRANPRLDVSAANTNNTFVFRIVRVSPTQENQDFSGNYVKLTVMANLFQRPPSNITGL